MTASSVYTISIPAEVRQMINEMKDVNWQSEIGQAVEELALERRRRNRSFSLKRARL